MTGYLRIAGALAWESWMLLRWGLLTRIALALAFVALFSALALNDQASSDSEFTGLKAAIMFVGMASVVVVVALVELPDVDDVRPEPAQALLQLRGGGFLVAGADLGHQRDLVAAGLRGRRPCGARPRRPNTPRRCP